MFAQKNSWKFKAVLADLFRHGKFLAIFLLVVIAPLVVFVVSGRGPNTLGQPGLKWSFLMIGLLLLIGLGFGLSRFRRKASSLSIKANSTGGELG